MKKILITAFLMPVLAAAALAAGPASLTTAEEAATEIMKPVPGVTTVITVIPAATAFVPTPDPARLAAGILPSPVTAQAAPAGVTDTAALTVTAKNMAPVNLQADTSGITKIKITWVSTSDEELTFYVQRKLSSEKEYLILNTEPLKVTAYVDASIRTATAYDYRIEARDNSGKAYVSDVKPVSSAGLGLPQRPFTFKAFQDVEKVTIKWSAGTRGSFDISGYNLYRGKTPDKLELLRTFPNNAAMYDDEDVEPAIKYYYRMRTLDSAGYESEPTETEAVVPFPKPRTGLVLMPSAFRNNIFDNMGFNADFIFTYYIGSIFSDHMWKGDSLSPLSVILFTGDVKGTVFNEFEAVPSLSLGFMYSILLQYDLGGSGATGASASFTPKDSVTQMYGVYIGASKKVVWDNTFHGGVMSGFGKDAQTRFMPYLAPAYLNDDSAKGAVTIEPSNFAYFIGFSRPLFWKMDLKAEIIVPIEANKTPWFPNYYLINTHIENFIRFDLAYMHYPGGSTLLGFINFRFSIYPNPYK